MSLLAEYPMEFHSDLAVAIGLNEAIFLSRIQYWLRHHKHEPEFQRDGRTWCRKTQQEWQQDLPFMSLRTVQRALAALEARGLILGTSAYNEHPMERRKWYTIDHTQVEALERAYYSGELHAVTG